ncbi:MAG: hypothetical protein IJH52_02270 [Oscillospiraceae bacterium]|nr:hypothetical protein [Oscillospiraceae bacterium]MBQ6403111.1 hypothetical protein [Oscillospiraceae bacterium]
MDKKKLSASWAIAFTVASVWFGTHVGGGFASGNQVIGYFAQFGSMGSLLFPLIAMGLLAIVMGIILKFARLNGFDNYKDTFAALYPHPKMEILFEIFYIVIILAAVAAAVAGAGEVLANFLGVPYVGAMKVVFNLLIVALLVILSIFGVKLVAAASTVLSVAIMIITGIIVVVGLAKLGMVNDLSAKYGVDLAAYTPQTGFSIFRATLVYCAFQCVSIPPMIAASNELNVKGTNRACFLGWLMNGIALALSAFMLSKWYPLLAALKAKAGEMQAAGTLEGSDLVSFANATGIPNQTVLTLIGVKILLVIFSVLLFCAFVSTCVTLIFTMVQRFAPKLAKVNSEGEFIAGIQNETLRRVIVAVVAIALCFSISLLGLTTITTKVYGYDGYYALAVVVLPAFIWGIPKNRKLEGK